MSPGLRAWLAAVWPDHDWRPAALHHGAFHDVAVCPLVVARVSRHGEQPERMARERGVLRSLERVPFPFVLPVPLSEVVTRHGRSAMLTTRVPGAPRPEAPWSDGASWFASALDAFAAAGRDASWLDDLPQPRAWCGGEQWSVIVTERLVPRLPPDLRAVAAGVVENVLAAERGRSFVHGDLRPHNLMWQGDRVVGLLDVDHACAGDPAIDVASLIGCYGAERVRQIVDDELVRRGKLHRATLGLQLAVAADLLGDGELRDHALRNFEARVRAGTLYDPGRD